MANKEWLDKLYYEIGKQNYDFELQIMKEGSTPSKRRKYSEVCFDSDNPKNQWFIENCNHRQLLANEIVLDLENKEKLNQVIDELKSSELNFYVYDTHSKGVHISIFFNREVTEKERLNFIKHFGGDIALASSRHMIALEGAEHWKSGKPKELIYGS